MPIGLLQLHLYVKMLDKDEFIGFFFFHLIQISSRLFLSIDPRWSPEELQQKWGHHMSVRERERKKWKTIKSFGYKKGICYMLQKIGEVKHTGTRGPKGTPLASQER